MHLSWQHFYATFQKTQKQRNGSNDWAIEQQVSSFFFSEESVNYLTLRVGIDSARIVILFITQLRSQIYPHQTRSEGIIFPFSPVSGLIEMVERSLYSVIKTHGVHGWRAWQHFEFWKQRPKFNLKRSGLLHCLIYSGHLSFRVPMSPHAGFGNLRTDIRPKNYDWASSSSTYQL